MSKDAMTETVEPLSDAEIEQYRIFIDRNDARLKAYDGPEPQVGNMTEVSNAMKRLLATIDHLQAQTRTPHTHECCDMCASPFPFDSCQRHIPAFAKGCPLKAASP